MRLNRACAVVVTLVLAGCGGHAAPASTGADLGESGTAAVDLLTRSGSYHARQHALTVAEEVLVGRCMAARGLVYTARTPPADRRTDEERALEMDKRRQVGYGLSKAGWDRPVTAVDRYVKGLSRDKQAAYLRVLFGSDDRRRGIDLPGGGQVTFPGEGCLFEAQSRLFGDIVTWARITYVPEELDNRLIDRAMKTPEYAKAMRRWSECMSRRGYRYRLPRDAEEDLTAEYRTQGPSEELRRHEIAVAVADGECNREAGIPALVLELKKKHVGTLTKDERRSLDHLAELWLDAAATAQGI